MGRVTLPEAAAQSAALKHFTHPHDLHPLSLYNPQALCSGCKLQSSGTMYTCTPCNFTLHKSCATLPQLISHPSHGGCTLSLLTAAAYPGGRFSCNACALTDDSWHYHCDRCDYDLHVICASKPLKINHRSHTSCSMDLELTFKNPYMDAKGFSCDVCRKIGTNQWLYRCNSCEFDVHVDCTSASPQPALRQQRSAPLPVAETPLHRYQFTHSASSGGMSTRDQFPAPPHAMAQNKGQFPAQPHAVVQVNGQFPASPHAVAQVNGQFPAPPYAAAQVNGFVQQQRSAAEMPHHRVQYTHSASSGGMSAHGQLPAPPQVNGFVGAGHQQPHLMHSASAGAIGNPYGGKQYRQYGGVTRNPAAATMNNGSVGNGLAARVGGLGGNIVVAALQGIVQSAAEGVGQMVAGDVFAGAGDMLSSAAEMC